MDSQDIQVLSQLHRWLKDGGCHWLCTVAATFGSSPRPVGSLLAVNADGCSVGSLSGGCVEEDLVEKIVAGNYGAGCPELVDYGLSAGDNERLGLPCGGHLRVLVEKFGPGQTVQLAQIVRALEARSCIRRVVDLSSGKFELYPVTHFAPLSLTGQSLEHTYGPSYLLLLIGAGQLAISLARFALAMDYRVVVCDPREALLAQWPVAGVQLSSAMPDDAVRLYAGDRHCIIITLTHDPRIDDMALMEALTTEAFYIGALGSIKTSELRRQRLRLLGLDEIQLARLRAPVGLAIGSKTPPEIAIAILAELTQLRQSQKQAGTKAVV